MNKELITHNFQTAIHGGSDIAEHLATLANYAELVPEDQTIVELGFRYGTSTWAFLASCKPIQKVASYDTGKCFIDTHKNAAPDNFLYRIRDSRLPYMDDKNVGMLFVDTVHTFIQVKDEVTAWMPFLAPNAFVAFHDTEVPGVRKAIDYFMKIWPSVIKHKVESCHGLTIIQGVSDDR